MSRDDILVAEKVSKRFDGRIALNEASLTVKRGSITRRSCSGRRPTWSS